MARTFHSRATGLSTRVGLAHAPDGQTGIGFSVIDGAVIVSVTIDGEGHAAVLKGDDIDQAAAFFADAVLKATRNDAPSLGTVQ